jgi:voltage-dependent anion channel protein 2
MAAPDFSDVSTPSDTKPIRLPVRNPKMTTPPAFSDIAKSSNDLINKDFYHANGAALEVKLKGPDGLSVTAKGTLPHSGDIAGSFEAKKILAKGVTVSQTLHKSELATTKVELDNVIAEGLKAEVLVNFSPKTGLNKEQKISLFWKNGPFHGRLFGNFNPATDNINAAADGVFSYNRVLLGGEAAYDVQKAALTRYAVALGFSDGPVSAAITSTNNLSVYSAHYYQKVNSAVEASLKAAYDTKSSTSIGFEIAAKYKLDPLSFAKAKIDGRGILSLAYNTKVNPGFTWGVGMSLDTQKLNEAGHKIGTSLTFEA